MGEISIYRADKIHPTRPDQLAKPGNGIVH